MRLEFQCVGPSIRTWLNGVAVANLFDDQSLTGFFGLQVHVGDQGKVRWRNIRVKDGLGKSESDTFFLGATDGKSKLERGRISSCRTTRHSNTTRAI